MLRKHGVVHAAGSPNKHKGQLPVVGFAGNDWQLTPHD